MYPFLISSAIAVAVWCGLYFGDILGYGWSSFVAVLSFIGSQLAIGMHF